MKGDAGESDDPLRVEGVVENGLVRPLDPAVKLPERSRVIIVAADGGPSDSAAGLPVTNQPPRQP